MKIFAIGVLLTVGLLTVGCSQRNAEPQYFAGDQSSQEVSPKDETGIDSHVYAQED